MEKIGLLGGTFDPIHNAHIQTALFFYGYLRLDKVIFIPTNVPPHKEKLSSTTAIDRLEMCKIALKGYPKFEVSDIEILRGGASYTFETLHELRKVYNDGVFYFILGADMFLTIDKWKKPEEIFDHAVLCVVKRNNINKEILLEYSKRIEKLGAKSIITDFKPDNISSTEIRYRINENKDISNLVPYEVKEYIYKNKLYTGWSDGFKYLQGNNKREINA